MVEPGQQIIVWDYGGVFTVRPRWQWLVEIVSGHDPFCADGLRRLQEERVLIRLADGSLSVDTFRVLLQDEYGVDADLFEEAARSVTYPTRHMRDLSCALADLGVTQIIVSDNIPFYTEVIVTSLAGLIGKFYLSDERRLRKDDGLIEEVLRGHILGAGAKWVYIDDRERFCKRVKGAFLGAEVIRFVDAKDCRSRITAWLRADPAAS